MHFTPAEVSQLSTAIVNASVLIIGAMAALVVTFLVYAGRRFSDLSLKVERNSVKLDNQAEVVNELGNNGGDKKIVAMINAKIIDGTLQKGRQNELTRATDTNTAGYIIPVVTSDSTSGG